MGRKTDGRIKEAMTLFAATLARLAELRGRGDRRNVILLQYLYIISIFLHK